MTNALIKNLEIIDIVAETDDARTIILKPLDDWQPQYKAGQFITLVFYTSTGEKRRSYSISSSPDAKESLAITVKKIANGEFSRRLVYHAKIGDILHASGIGGFFTLPEYIDQHIYCFLAAGSGITPCFSLIKTLLLKTSKPVFLFYSNRSEKDVIFLYQLKALHKKYNNRFYIHFMYSDRLDVYYSRLSHWLLTWLIEKHFSGTDKNKMLFYICGPFDYMLTATISLRNNGVKNEQIFKEEFNPLPPAKLPTPPDKDPHYVTIQVDNKQYTILVQYPQSIVAAAKLAHIIVPYSCEAGRCGSCVATCIKGKIWMAYNEVLMDNEIKKGRVLTCQGFPVGGDAAIVYE